MGKLSHHKISIEQLGLEMLAQSSESKIIVIHTGLERGAWIDGYDNRNKERKSFFPLMITRKKREKAIFLWKGRQEFFTFL